MQKDKRNNMNFEIKETNNGKWLLIVDSTIQKTYSFDKLEEVWEEIQEWLS